MVNYYNLLFKNSYLCSEFGFTPTESDRLDDGTMIQTYSQTSMVGDLAVLLIYRVTNNRSHTDSIEAHFPFIDAAEPQIFYRDYSDYSLGSCPVVKALMKYLENCDLMPTS